MNISSVSKEVCEDCSTKVHIGWLVGGIVIAAAVVAAVVAAVLFGLTATKCITISFNRGEFMLCIVSTYINTGG